MNSSILKNVKKPHSHVCLMFSYTLIATSGGRCYEISKKVSKQVLYHPMFNQDDLLQPFSNHVFKNMTHEKILVKTMAESMLSLLAA